jgi:electron transfer flavoprotein beta subunit
VPGSAFQRRGTSGLQGRAAEILELIDLKIGVCVKQVPVKDAPLTVIAGGAWIRESDVTFETNEPDTFALEEALRLKEKHGGEIVVISMGPERAKESIKDALAKGADRGIHILDVEFFQLDPFASARSITLAIQAERFDLILTGLQSNDYGFGQTGVLLAELLSLPHATIVMEIEIVDGRMKVKRELEAGWFQRVEVPLPAVITIQSGINKPRYATLKGVMAAKKKDIAVVERTSLDVRGAVSQRIERIYIPEKAKQTEFITGNPDEIAIRLMDKIKHGSRNV